MTDEANRDWAVERAGLLTVISLAAQRIEMQSDIIRRQADEVTELRQERDEARQQAKEMGNQIGDLMVEREMNRRLPPEHIVCPMCEEINTYSTNDGRYCPDCGACMHADGSLSI